VYHTHIRDVDHLKIRLVEEWQMSDQDYPLGQQPGASTARIRVCIREQGGHFEHQLSVA